MSPLILLLFIFHLLIPGSPEKICKTPECQKIADRYLKHLNDSVKPCDNFYNFICGKYQENHKVSETQDKISVLQEIQETIDLELLEILKNNGSGGVYRKIHNYFDSCVEVEHRDGFRDVLLKQQIENFGGWKLVNEGVKNEEWESIAGKMFGHGFQAMVKIVPGPIFENTKSYGLLLLAPTVYLDDDLSPYIINKSPILASYRNLINSTLALLGINDQKIIDDILEVEKTLVKASISDGSTDYGKNYTVIQIKETVPSMNWNVFFEKSGLILTDSTEIRVIDPNYLVNFEKILKEYAKMPEKIVNYLMWVLVAESAKYMGKKWVKPLNEFEKNTKGFYTNYSSWQFCVSESRKKFPNLLVHQIFSKTYTASHKSLTKSLISNIKSAMKTEIEGADWLGNSTKSALEKLEVMREKIGYPEVGQEEVLDKPFENICIKHREFLRNEMKLRKIEQLEKFQLIGKSTHSFWENSLEADAVYHPSFNEIQIKAAISTHPMLVPGIPSAILYGSFGSVIGHEISHGFDTTGANFDANGNSNNWWEEDAYDKLQKRISCLNIQYGMGGSTLGEDIADNGGLRIAYEAYRSISEKEDQKLPGLEKYTNDQLFFMAYGHNFCTSYKESTIAHILKTDPHSIGQKRVNIPLQNFEKFSEVFKCEVGDLMRLEETCRVW
ncbi:unnamed protein product [Caenorhabditis angaria]|uniref:Peptidase M13 C-terminal domain-containing protein n=1 Tax=Caenorhabditis angaria TaxID=860376 RepID=A0A9P1N053_9PELO|nr:unnamed protein product [Caenorhabditis angaria]